ncbi:MAG TPA: DUF2017 family protein [Verrucomicrobiae bacterium]|nr:DUF2017 family protein [Verrucomicrobiae bacterium]
MKASRDGDRIVLALGGGEALILRWALVSLVAAYRVPPGQIDPRIAAVWYSRRGCQTAKMSEEDAGEWVRQIHAFKSENLALIEAWLGQLAKKPGRRIELVLTVDQAEAFVRVLNDHRLRAAAEHEIGQEEMDIRDPGPMERLGPERQTALVEIHFFAWAIEEILRQIAPDAAGWGAGSE